MLLFNGAEITAGDCILLHFFLFFVVFLPNVSAGSPYPEAYLRLTYGPRRGCAEDGCTFPRAGAPSAATIHLVFMSATFS